MRAGGLEYAIIYADPIIRVLGTRLDPNIRVRHGFLLVL